MQEHYGIYMLFALLMFIMGGVVVLNIWYVTIAHKQLLTVKTSIEKIGAHLLAVDESIGQVAQAFKDVAENLAAQIEQMQTGGPEDEGGVPDEGGDESDQEDEPEAEPNPNVNDQASAYVAPVPEQGDWSRTPLNGLVSESVNPKVQWLFTDPFQGGSLAATCAKPGCKHSPTHYLKLVVDHDPTDNDEPDAVITVGVALCLQHLVVPIDQVVMRCAHELGSMGIFQISTDAVHLEPGLIGDDGWQHWLSVAALRGGGGRA